MINIEMHNEIERMLENSIGKVALVGRMNEIISHDSDGQEYIDIGKLNKVLESIQ
jgi:hypothetical protein